MGYIALNEDSLVFVKRGKIVPHKSKSKGKVYLKGKIYMGDSREIGLCYQLYKVDNLHLVNIHKQHRTGKAYVVFIQN